MRTLTLDENYKDAFCAGSFESSQCVLYICSNKYVDKIESNIHVGKLVIRNEDWGNINNLSFIEMINHRGIILLKCLTGLRLHFNYTDSKNYKTLRYGRIVLYNDVFINRNILIWLDKFYPSLKPFISIKN